MNEGTERECKAESSKSTWYSSYSWYTQFTSSASSYHVCGATVATAPPSAFKTESAPVCQGAGFGFG